ncbi:adhesion G protein-coupled receptor E3-like isoform X1 [Hemitrygon akajei]|uniref:adhesion G protein-coupled receptor E3-like isoform X1 n=1 Tax=Hemitrygon akajei TaxID=2704970 RepID=UPI003BF9844D
MEWRCSSLEWVLCLSYILSLPVVSSQPCQPGYKLEADLDCIDINECAEVAQICGPNTRCHNIMGSYFCTCMQGFHPYINASHGTSCQEVARHTRLRKRAALIRQNVTAPDHGNNMPSEHSITMVPEHEGIPDNRNTPEPGSGNFPEHGNGNTFDLIMQSTSKSANRNITGPGNENVTKPGNLRTAEPGYGSTAEPGNKSSSDSYNQNISEHKGSMPRTGNGYTPERGNRSTPEAGNGSRREATTELDPGPSSTLSTDVRNHSDPAGQWDLRLTTTLEQPASPGRLFCSMITNVSRLFNKPCYNPIKGSPLEDVVRYITQLLMEDFPLAGMRQDERINSASSILMAVERVAVTLGLTSALDQVMAMPSQEMELQVIRVDSSRSADGIQLQAKDNALELLWTTANNTFGKGSAVLAFIVYNNLDPVLQGACYKDKESGDLQDDVQLHSKVVSAALEFSPRTNFSVVVNFVLKHKEVGTTAGRLSCVYWNHTPTGSYWSTSGCELIQSNFSHTTCQCQHLSSFAILMSFNKQLQGYSQDCLSVITFIGIPISLVCLLSALATFTLCSQARNAVSTTHTHLCLSLFLAELLFLVGINRTVNRAMCGIVAGCLHYLFLVAFTWMSLESTQLYLMVRNLRKMRVSNSSQLGKFIYPLGYGSPALIVAISAVIYPNGYGSERNCWLQVENGFAWSFLGPVYFFILVNTFLFTMTLYTLNEELSNRDTKVSKIKDTRMLIFKAISQVFILGCTWILGLFHFQEETVVMAYLFTIVNSFQGTFIFIILCLLNPKASGIIVDYLNIYNEIELLILPGCS